MKLGRSEREIKKNFGGGNMPDDLLKFHFSGRSERVKFVRKGKKKKLVYLGLVGRGGFETGPLRE